MRKVNRKFVQPTPGFNQAHRINAQERLQARVAEDFEYGNFNDGIGSHEDWSRNDTRHNAPRYAEGQMLLRQLESGPRLRPHRA